MSTKQPEEHWFSKLHRTDEKQSTTAEIRERHENMSVEPDNMTQEHKDRGVLLDRLEAAEAENQEKNKTLGIYFENHEKTLAELEAAEKDIRFWREQTELRESALQVAEAIIKEHNDG